MKTTLTYCAFFLNTALFAAILYHGATALPDIEKAGLCLLLGLMLFNSLITNYKLILKIKLAAKAKKKIL